MKQSIVSVWSRIEAHAGELFEQARGATFTYRVVGGHVVPDRTDQQIPKSHFAKALDLVPLSGPGEIQPAARALIYLRDPDGCPDQAG
jgi:hypothetical protein